ncbi:hypothetical protein LCGC14_2061160, partial [marine sediment metagenome]
AYRDEYGLDAIYLLPVNLFGPEDNFDLETSHVIPAIIRKCVLARKQKKRSITLWGDGAPTREFLYVEDAARGIADAAEGYDGAAPVNLGSGEEITIRNLVREIVALTRFRGDVAWDTTKPNGQPRRCLDTSRARDLFGWEATVPLREGLRRTVEWYLGQDT